MGINPDREKKYKFSKCLSHSQVRVLVIRENEKILKILMMLKVRSQHNTFTSNYGKLAKIKVLDITKVDGFNQSMDLLLSKRVDGTFNDNSVIP